MDRPITRHVLDLSGWWHTWFDTAAEWRIEAPADPHTPPQDLAPHAPSAGWEGMDGGMESLRVPGTWAESRPGYRGVAWHWRPLVVPPEYAEHTLRLRFEGVRLRAEVYLDRRLIGHDLDGLTPFEIDVTDLIRPDRRHELALRVTNPGGTLPGQEPQRLAWAGKTLLPSHDLGGIWGDVSLVAVPPAYLRDVWASAGDEPGVVCARCTVHNAGDERTVNLEAHLLDGNGHSLGAAEPSMLTLSAAEAREVVLPIRATGLRPWSPDDPVLYRVQVELRGEGIVDRVRAPYAPHILGRTEAGYTLNGEPLEVRTARTGGWYPEVLAFPSDRLAEEEVREAKRLGLNALRFVGHVPTEALLDVADRQGLLILQDAAILAADGSEGLLRQLSDERRKRLTARLRAHPCVLWTSGGEEGYALADGPPEADDAPRPLVRRLSDLRPGLPDPPSVLRRYGDRMLPGSDAEAWASNLLDLSRGFAARGLERVFPDVSSLTRATSRAAYREVAEAIEDARVRVAAGYELPRWADEPRGPLGLLDVHRMAKGDETLLTAANAPVMLALGGVSPQHRSGAPGVLKVMAINHGRWQGPHSLRVRLSAPNGRLVFEEAGWVSLSGLPAETLTETPFRPEGEGEFVLRAELSRDGRVLVAARRSMWVAEGLPSALAAAPGGDLGVLGPAGALSDLLDRWGVHWMPYALGRPAAGLVATTAGATAGGLANVLFAGAVRRVAWLLADAAEIADGWGALLPQLGSTVSWPSEDGGSSWLVAGRHPLLRGGGDPGLWWHAGGGLLPHYGLREPLGVTLLSACYLAGEGAPGLATVMGIDRLGEAEMLFCSLPLIENAARGGPVAERLLGNVIGWLRGGPTI